MPGNIWGLLSPRLQLWAGADEIRIVGASGDTSAVPTGAHYRRGEIVDPRGLSKALVLSYREYSHRSYGVSPYVHAHVPPGTSPAGLFVWDAVLRTSAASDWVLEDSGPAYFRALKASSQKDGPARPGEVTGSRAFSAGSRAFPSMAAMVFLMKTCCAWEVLRCSASLCEVAACGRVGFGLADGLDAATLAGMLSGSMKEGIAAAAASMVEDEVALVAASPVTVLVDGDTGAEAGVAGAVAAACKEALGGGGDVQVAELPKPAGLES